MKEIIIDVDATGEVKVETKGFKGKSCLKESAFIENVLGKETFKQLTPAYFEFDGSANATKKFLPLCG